MLQVSQTQQTGLPCHAPLVSCVQTAAGPCPVAVHAAAPHPLAHHLTLCSATGPAAAHACCGLLLPLRSLQHPMPQQLLRLWLLLLLRPQEFQTSPAVNVLAAAGVAEHLAFGCLLAAAVGEEPAVQQVPQQRLLLLAQPGQWVWVC